MKPLNYNRELIERCKRKEASAQYALYQSYSRAMYNVCLRMLRNEMDAEDILQNSFVDVYTNLDSFNYQATPGAWIKRIVINNCINHLKKRRISFEEMENCPDVTVEPYNDEEYEVDVNLIKSAMNLLSDGYRTVFSLYALEGYDHGEIADILEISESTSKSQYHRAKNKIKKMLIS